MTTFALWFLVCVGAAAVLVAMIGVYGLCVDGYLEWRRAPHQRSFYEGMQHVRQQLSNDAWWFSESPETCDLLIDLSRGMEISQAREKWRKARAAQSTEAVT